MDSNLISGTKEADAEAQLLFKASGELRAAAVRFYFIIHDG